LASGANFTALLLAKIVNQHPPKGAYSRIFSRFFVKLSESYGYLLPTRGLVLKGGKPDFATILGLAQDAERSGFDSLWVGDSILAKPRLEPIATLAAVASVCRKVTLGMSVLLPALRQPVVLAHALSTLDLIASGRLLIGVGNGGPFEIYQKEFGNIGVPLKQRISRTDETVQVLKMLWSKDHVSFSGKTCTLTDVSLEPKPFNPGGPKILMSAGLPMTDVSIRRVATITDGWMTAQVSPSQYRDIWSKIKAVEPNKELIPSLYMTMNLSSNEKTAKAESIDYLEKYYGAAAHLETWGPFGGPEAVVERLNEYRDAGARIFAIRFSSFEQEKQISLFTEKVLPHLKH
jgi:alkanesulfonate monooxygenase SsuD/methylene tetrahydromethanopterin reductase-like flavin-dependent oxidoreductase (luciferase family)